MKLKATSLLGLALCLTFFLPSASLKAQTTEPLTASAGTWHSPKGFGATADIYYVNDHFSSFSLSVDLEGILSGKSSTPGTKFRYNYNLPLKMLKTGHGDHVLIYAGPGAALGYVRDTNSRIGLMGGLAADIGCIVFLASKVSLSLEFGGELAFHLREDNRYGVKDFKFYEAGVARIYLPQLRLQYYW